MTHTYVGRFALFKGPGIAAKSSLSHTASRPEKEEKLPHLPVLHQAPEHTPVPAASAASGSLLLYCIIDKGVKTPLELEITQSFKKQLLVYPKQPEIRRHETHLLT